MFYTSKIYECLKNLIDDEVKDFVTINFSKYLKSMRKKFYSKQNEEQNLRKVAKSLYIFPTISDEVEDYAKMMQSNSSEKC